MKKKTEEHTLKKKEKKGINAKKKKHDERVSNCRKRCFLLGILKTAR